MSGPEGSSIKHCIVCAVGIFCPEHSTLQQSQRRKFPALFLCMNRGMNRDMAEIYNSDLMPVSERMP